MRDRRGTTVCWALVPIKARAACKSRLSEITEEERRRLVELMLDSVISALLAADAVDRIAIVTPEPGPVPPGVLVLPDDGSGLNEALVSARDRVREMGATEIIILPSDLPFVRGADVDAMIQQGRRSGFALASDAAGIGTNALFLTADLPYLFCFGHGSREKHLAQALQLGLRPAMIHSERLEFDIDTQHDLRRLVEGYQGCFKASIRPTGACRAR